MIKTNSITVQSLINENHKEFNEIHAHKDSHVCIRTKQVVMTTSS